MGLMFQVWRLLFSALGLPSKGFFPRERIGEITCAQGTEHLQTAVTRFCSLAKGFCPFLPIDSQTGLMGGQQDSKIFLDQRALE